MGFIINRSGKIDPEKGKELDWVREIWNTERKLIIKLNGSFLANLLSKIRNRQKHNAPDQILEGVLDRYVRLYLSGASRNAKR